MCACIHTDTSSGEWTKYPGIKSSKSLNSTEHLPKKQKAFRDKTANKCT